MKRLRRRKLVNNKKRIIFYSIFFMLFFISIGYAYLNTTLSINSHVKLNAIKDFNLIIDNLPKSCINTFTGLVTDEVGNTVNATNVVFNNCSNKRNVIFGGSCWQVIRTTETGGTKMIYNGEPVDGKCESTRSSHKGISGTDGMSETLNGSYSYGKSFIYDENNNTFTLENTFTSTWNDANYTSLLGTYTCKTSTNTCSTIYNINGYESSTSAVVTKYTIDNGINYSAIGTSPYNPNFQSVASVGYMFGNVYKSTKISIVNATIKYGNSFTYNNGTYTLSGTTQTLNYWPEDYLKINNTHYTCLNSTGTCSTIYYINATDSQALYRISLTNGKNVQTALNEMIVNDDINRYNSSIKGLVDNWYKHNLLQYASFIEDTVYCNDRYIFELGGWNPNGGSTYGEITDMQNHLQLFFNNTDDFINNNDLSCPSYKDQFAVSNNKAKLIYPVGLPTLKEMNNINQELRATGSWYNTMTPGYYGTNFARMRLVYGTGETRDIEYHGAMHSGDVRPMITLKEGIVIASGDGSEARPWIVDETSMDNMIDTYDNKLKNTYLSDTYRNKIKTITLNDSINVPNDAVVSWDIGVIQNNKVMAYLKTNSSDNTMYDLYIEGDGELKANYDSSKLFYDMANLENINNLTVLDTSKSTNMSYMFSMSGKLTTLDLSNFDTSNVKDMSVMFGGIAEDGSQVNMSLTNIIGLKDLDVRKVTNMDSIFMNLNEIITIDISNWNTASATNMHNMFNGSNNYNSKLTTIRFGPNFNTSKVTDMVLMFADNPHLANIDLSRFDTSNVTDMNKMFSFSTGMTTLNLSSFNTSKVTDMSYMFNGMEDLSSKLTTIVFGPNFVTNNVTNMSFMFTNNTKITNLNLSSFNTSKVTNMSRMFSRDTGLVNLNLSGWDTSKVNNMSLMFFYCSSLKSLNIQSFDFSAVTNTSGFVAAMSTRANGQVVRVKNATARSFILGLTTADRPSDWDTTNVIIN